MGIIRDAVSNIRKVVLADDEGFLNDGNEFLDENDGRTGLFPKFGSKNPGNKSFIPFQKQNKNMNFADLDVNEAKQNVQNRRDNRGHIQVYVPRSFDEAFDIIKNIEGGSTAMVNVETASQHNATRIIDVISGAMFALKGQCKKIGEKQYIFTLNAELSGAIDFLPGQNNPYMKEYQGFDMQNPFTFGQNYGQMQNPYQGQAPSFQQPMGQPQSQFNPYQNMQNQNFDYVKPQNQF